MSGAVAELADAEDLKSSGGDTLWVQVPLAPQSRNEKLRFFLSSPSHRVLNQQFFQFQNPGGNFK